jgi:hypothetical protein
MILDVVYYTNYSNVVMFETISDIFFDWFSALIFFPLSINLPNNLNAYPIKGII